MFNNICRKLEIPYFTGKMLCLMLVFIIVIIISVFLHNKYVKKEGFTPSKRLNFVFCSMDGCPYCEDTKPEWDKLTNDFTHTDLSYTLLDSRKDSDFMRKHDVAGFPTFLLLNKDGTKHAKQFNGPRKKNAMMSFLKGVLGN